MLASLLSHPTLKTLDTTVDNSYYSLFHLLPLFKLNVKTLRNFLLFCLKVVS